MRAVRLGPTLGVHTRKEAYVVVLVAQDLPLFWAVEIALPPVVAGLLLLLAGRSEHDRRA